MNHVVVKVLLLSARLSSLPNSIMLCHTYTHPSFSALVRHRTDPLLFTLVCWHDFNQFGAALSQPVDITVKSRLRHRLPRSKSLEISWSFDPPAFSNSKPFGAAMS
ncbi:hypothetical protein DFH94DRAFT_182877 [Russula ochroleuca]|uniref:Secreted protein n=1 Tax=Russula ochroleuca TaxID=152965 RepID=A0A9P5N4W4_9AGAM|nr:hypothetical protein DFH94DRAFT_182877 [Russula ochroleuca]